MSITTVKKSGNVSVSRVALSADVISTAKPMYQGEWEEQCGENGIFLICSEFKTTTAGSLAHDSRGK